MTDVVLPEKLASVEPVRSVRTPARLDYEFVAGRSTTNFLRGITQHKLVGERCPVCGKVYVPSRGACPSHGVPTEGQVEVADVGTLVSFCVVNVQFYGSVMEIPYVTGNILLDGADMYLMHLLQEVPADQVRIGMRLQAVWKDDDELEPTLESIKYFRPNGEPDVDVHQPGESGWDDDGAGA